MKNYLYYKQHNQEEYDYTSTDITSIKPKEAILLKCINCKGNYSNAYKCTEYSCPLYYMKNNWMKRPHTCSDWFVENRNKIEDMWR